MSDAQAPMGAPGDIINWPMLKVHYRTDPEAIAALLPPCLLYTSPSPRDGLLSRMPSSA